MKTVLDNQYYECVGCNGCVQICPQSCITVQENNEGFWYPYIDENSCVECNKCREICPVNAGHRNDRAYPQAFGAKNKDDSIREKSTSGGLFSVFAHSMLENNGLVIGAVFDDDMNLKYAVAANLNDLEKMRGSKYLQSDIGDTYVLAKNMLLNRRNVLFVGTPCQVAGLYSFLGSDFEGLLTCDFICHGVSSPGVFKDYLHSKEEKAQSKVREFVFRDKKTGWKMPSTVIKFANLKSETCLFKNDVFSLAFRRNLILRPSCYRCKFSKIPRASDLTLADFWGVQEHCPELDDNKGTSLVLVNSEKGVKWFDLCSDKMIFKKVKPEKALSRNRNATSSVKLPVNRKSYFEDLTNHGFSYVESKYMKPSHFLRRLFKKILIIIKRRISRFLNF
jgi:coenzyme F420-reducing hydrogenase beta subunit